MNLFLLVSCGTPPCRGWNVGMPLETDHLSTLDEEVNQLPNKAKLQTHDKCFVYVIM